MGPWFRASRVSEEGLCVLILVGGRCSYCDIQLVFTICDTATFIGVAEQKGSGFGKCGSCGISMEA